MNDAMLDAAPDEAVEAKPDIKLLTELVDRRCRAEEFSGALLVQQGQIPLFQAASGFANRSWKVNNRPDTRFRIASISKMFTAAAVLQLIDRGSFSFDTRVLEYLDLQKTTIPPDVNVYHLLTMTAGIADWFDESGDWEANWAALCRQHPIYLFRTNADYLPLFTGQKPLYSPGERYQYNGASYILLGLMIEKAAGTSYFDYVQEHIFARAGMNRSGFFPLDEVHAEVAGGYIPVQGPQEEILGWKRNIYSTTPQAAADGGACSTLADLARFLQVLRSGELLSEQMSRAMLEPKVSMGAEKIRGYTWQYGFANTFLLNDHSEIVRWGHTGEEDGVSCRLYHYPRPGLDVVLLGNQSWCAGETGWAVHDWIIEQFDISSSK